ncbi:MAG: cytochrome c [Gemmataceae bacterium]
MRRNIASGIVIAIGFGLGACVAEFVIADDKREEGRRVEAEDIMKKNHGKKGGLIPKIADLVKNDKIADALPLAKQAAALAASLPKDRPKKGDKKSWDELSKDYADTTKDLAAAIEKKDVEAAKSALSAINGSCKACHEAHTNRKK